MAVRRTLSVLGECRVRCTPVISWGGAVLIAAHRLSTPAGDLANGRFASLSRGVVVRRRNLRRIALVFPGSCAGLVSG